MPTNRMPAISNDVPIGYLMKGEEMLSFMSAHPEEAAGASSPDDRD